MKVFIAGTGMTKFGQFKDKSASDLVVEAVDSAIDDSIFDRKDIQSAYCSNVLAGRIEGLFQICAQIYLEKAGIVGIPIVRVENACASGATALRQAYMEIQAGAADIVLVVGVEKMTGRAAAPLKRDRGTYEGQMGWNVPGLFAIRAQKYLDKYNYNSDDLAYVSVKNKNNASLNPNAHFSKTITYEDVIHSEMVCDPLRLLEMSPVSDGAAAVVLVSEREIKKFNGPFVEVRAVELTSGTYDEQRDFTFNDLERRAFSQAMEKAAMGVEDLSFAEVHDCFSIAEVLRVESLGLVEVGTYLNRLKNGEFSLVDKLPINPSGGLLGKGHPTGATGVAQVVEVVKQLNRNAGKRQINDAKCALTHCSGGAHLGDTGACSVALFSI